MDLKEVVQKILRVAETAALEDKLIILKDKWLAFADKKDSRISHHNDWKRIWDKVVEADPTNNKAYLQWLIIRVLDTREWKFKSYNMYREDLNEFKYLFKKFDDLKRKNKLKPEHKDINRIKTATELFKILLTYDDNAKSNRETEKEFEANLFKDKEAILFYDSPTIKVIIPKTHKASCYFGKNTRWCTTERDDASAFDDYSIDGPLYIVLHKPTNRRWQFHFDSNQFMDETDIGVEWKDLYKEKPLIDELRKIFNKEAIRYTYIALMIKYDTVDIRNYINIHKSEPLFELLRVLHQKLAYKDLKIIFDNYGWPTLKTNKLFDTIKEILPTTNNKRKIFTIAVEKYMNETKDISYRKYIKIALNEFERQHKGIK